MTTLSLSLSATLDNFTLDITQEINLNGIVGLFGHSGAGKSSLLKAIAGLNGNVHGVIKFNNKLFQDSANSLHLACQQRKVVGVFQQDCLFPHLSVKDNLMFGRKRLAQPRFDAKQLIAQTGLEHLLHRDVASLSGGERQRVAIAQAILAEPELLILDEPVTALDKQNKSLLLAMIKQLHQATQLPILYVSHDIHEHQQLCDQLYVMALGKIIHHGDIFQVIHYLTNNEQINAQCLINAKGLINAKCQQQHSDNGLIALITDNQNQLFTTLNNQQPIPANGRYLISASDISICTQPPHHSSIVNQIAGVITQIKTSQHQTLLTINCQGDVFFSNITTYSLNQLGLTLNQSVYIQFKASAVRALVN
ncbi:molybdenum ABC transporter ATP-binding protein [Colwellia sp. MEBiC06753]